MAIAPLKKGNLLIAEVTSLGDEFFNRTVVFLTEHNQEGSVGFILNKPTSFTLTDFITEITTDFTVFEGGPVEQNNLYFIHNCPHLIPDSVPITDTIYWGGNFEVVISLINKKEITKKNIRFFLGYSGWHFQQLEQEISEKSWIVEDNTLKEELLEKASINLWKEKIKQQGGDYVLFSNAPSDPTLN